jgi:hypothetical protein
MGLKSKGGASKKGRQHVAHERKYQKQFTRTAKNKENAWSRHLAKHPKDLRAREQIKKVRG